MWIVLEVELLDMVEMMEDTPDFRIPGVVVGGHTRAAAAAAGSGANSFLAAGFVVEEKYFGVQPNLEVQHQSDTW